MTGRVRLLVVLLAALFLGVPAAASASVQLSDIDGPGFPSKSFLLTLPTRQVLTTKDVQVTENNRAVAHLTVVPNSQAAGTTFGTVLVIDASSSMHGQAIKSAVSAAQAFASQHDPRQPLGAVFFAETPTVTLPLTTDQARIRSALATVPPVTKGTHLYDGVQQATQMLVAAKVAAGAIVVLSDGSDTGSGATERSVVDAAQKAHLRIYSVGLQTRAFSRKTLASLATAAGGSFATATTSGLAALYGRLGSELSNQYVVRYQSTATLGSAVRADVSVRGSGTAHADYFAPALNLVAPGATTTSEVFWRTQTALYVLSGGVALLIALALLLLLVPRDSLRTRVGQFVTPPEATDDRAWASTLVERALGDGKRRGDRRSILDMVLPTAEQLELAQVGMTRVQVLLGTLGLTILAGFFFVTTLDTPLAAVLALLVPYVVRLAVRVQLDRQRRLFDSQLPDNLQVIASAMRAGYTFLGALGTVVVDAPEPSRREFRRVLADEQLGIPLAEALTAVAVRMGSSDFDHVALVATLQGETGGNTAEVIDQVGETIRERQELRRLIRTLTAQGRLAGFVVSGLPIALLIIIAFVSPDYIHPLFHRGLGIAMLVMATIMLATGASLIKRIVNIDV